MSETVTIEGNEHPDVECYTAVKHANETGAGVGALWRLSGYSFDGFSAELEGVFADLDQLEKALESRGRPV